MSYALDYLETIFARADEANGPEVIIGDGIATIEKRGNDIYRITPTSASPADDPVMWFDEEGEECAEPVEFSSASDACDFLNHDFFIDLLIGRENIAWEMEL